MNLDNLKQIYSLDNGQVGKSIELLPDQIRQVLEERDSYQHACASRFAERGYLVFAMENVGMEPDRDGLPMCVDRAPQARARDVTSSDPCSSISSPRMP